VEEPPFKHQCVKKLTELLVEADEGRVRSLVLLWQDSEGEYHSDFTGCERRSEVGAQLMRLALERLGIATLEDLRRDGEG
jgi:hypothetical protein